MSKNKGEVSRFIAHHYRHFNAARLMDAARGYEAHLDQGGKMMVTLAGAMSTGELGLSLAEMIRQDKVHAISCTGANLEEDVFNLIAHDHYKRIPNYDDLKPEEELRILDDGYSRVTDTCIPEEEAMIRMQKHMVQAWKAADEAGKSYLPHEFIYQVLQSKVLEPSYQIDPKNSWLLAASEKNIPIFVPGWEDSTLGNVFTAQCIKGVVSKTTVVRSGLEYMVELCNWYQENSQRQSIGFFQIGGGIAGDFPICVVPMLDIDLKRDPRKWGYFCQISDSTTSYGSYSGAVPNEKISWAKLDVDTPSFMIESDATIVAPLIFAYVLGW